ncbi:uncharacterized protein DS421_1g25560 [Arachis hypogaea]|nr:uncharacterized protein DS421_1g25560 [Arachis hypogaea]
MDSYYLKRKELVKLLMHAFTQSLHLQSSIILYIHNIAIRKKEHDYSEEHLMMSWVQRRANWEFQLLPTCNFQLRSLIFMPTFIICIIISTIFIRAITSPHPPIPTTIPSEVPP